MALARRPVGNAAHMSSEGSCQSGSNGSTAPQASFGLEHPCGGDAQAQAGEHGLAHAFGRRDPQAVAQGDGRLGRTLAEGPDGAAAALGIDHRWSGAAARPGASARRASRHRRGSPAGPAASGRSGGRSSPNRRACPCAAPRRSLLRSGRRCDRRGSPPPPAPGAGPGQRQTRDQMEPGEDHGGAEPQSAGQPGAGAAGGEIRLVRFLDRVPGVLEEALAGLGRGQGAGRSEQQSRAEALLQLAIVFETAGCPTPSWRAAAVNEPVSTTRTNASIAARRSMPRGWPEAAAQGRWPGVRRRLPALHGAQIAVGRMMAAAGRGTGGRFRAKA